VVPEKPAEILATVDVASHRATITQRGDGLYVARWREAGKGRNTTSKSLERVKELARKRLKDLSRKQGGRVLTIEDAELVELTKRLAGTRSPFVWLHEVEDAQKRLQGLATLSQAVKYYDEAGMLEVEPMLLAHAWTRFIAAYKPEGMDSVSSMRKAILSYANAHKGIMMHEIEAGPLEAWLKRNDVAASTYNNRRGFWITFMNWCRKHLKCLAKKEEHAAERLPKMKEGDRVPPIFTPEAAVAALKVIPDHYLPTFIVGTWMGPRPESELRRIDWKHFDWKRDYLHVVLEVARKTPRERFVPIPANVKAMLKGFIKPAGRISGRDHVTRISQILRATKVIDVWPQDIMRHSSISYCIAAGNGAGQVAEWHGNSEGIIKRRYRRPLNRHDAKEWYAIGLTRATAIEKLRA
jgi:integrase